MRYIIEIVCFFFVTYMLTVASTSYRNVNPTLSYEDNSFDVVTCVVSIDYLTKPMEVLKEVNALLFTLFVFLHSCCKLTKYPSQQVHRVLKPGGKVIISQSNRCFPSKAISMWLNMNDRQHLELINGYLKYAGFGKAQAFDITASVPGERFTDPMFIVEVTK